MREGIADGVSAPRIVAERALAQTERLIEAGAADSPVLAPVPVEDADGRARLAAAVADHLLPALQRYRQGIRDYLANATETIGLRDLPGGEAMYAAQILSWTTLELDAREVHELGTADLEKIQDERARAAAILGHPDAATAEAAIARDAAFRFGSPEELKATAEEQVRRSWDLAPTWFGRVPSANCEVRLVEEFREADMPFAFYNQPTEDGSRPGVYYVNGFDLARKPKHQLASTTYHEANPGHHFQVALEQEMDGRPALRRFGGPLAGSAFTEGWGLYSERLADELGLYRDEFERLGMLEAQGWRACRLIVDTGIHAFRWDRQRAVDQMVEGGVGRLNAQIEVDRYIAVPGQALAYKIG